MKPGRICRVDACALITLDSVTDEVPNDAIVRLRPPRGMSASEVEAWRKDVIAKGARAVRVLPLRLDADVPMAAQRARIEVSTPRQEVARLLKQADDEHLTAFCEQIMEQCEV